MLLEEVFAKRVVKLLDKMDTYEVTSEEYKALEREAVDMGKLGIEIAKVNSEHEDRIESRTIDRNLRISQLKEERNERKSRLWFDIGKAASGIALTLGCSLMAYNFEKYGTVITPVGREHTKQGFRIK